MVSLLDTFADLEAPLYEQPLFHVDAPDRDPESEVQRLGRFRADMRIHGPAVTIVGVPNAAKRGQWALNQARKEGLYLGFPDVMCLARSNTGAPLIAFLEWKAGKGRPSSRQVDCLNMLAGMGFPCGVFRRAETAMAMLRRAGFPFLERGRG